jgi:hypothetical protein
MVNASDKNGFDNSEQNDTMDLFRVLLEDAPKIVGEMKKEMLFPADLNDGAWDTLKETYGFNIKKMGKSVKRYLIDDDDGKIVLKLFRTNKDGIFVGRYEHPNGSLHWSLRPKKLKNEK